MSESKNEKPMSSTVNLKLKDPKNHEAIEGAMFLFLFRNSRELLTPVGEDDDSHLDDFIEDDNLDYHYRG